MVHKHAKLCLYVTIHAASSMLRMQPEVNNPNSRVVTPKSRGWKLLALSLWRTRGSWQSSIYVYDDTVLLTTTWEQALKKVRVMKDYIVLSPECVSTTRKLNIW